MAKKQKASEGTPATTNGGTENPDTTTAAAEGDAPKAKKVKPPKEPKPVVEKDSKNGITRPAAGEGPCHKVWSVCDVLAVETEGGPAAVKKAAVVAKLAEYGVEVNAATTSTQYTRWKKYHGLTDPARAPGAKKVTTEAAATVEGETAAA